MDGENQQTQSQETPKATGPGVKDSIKKLRARFVPGVKYSLIIAAAFNLAMLVVGCVNVHRCPVNKNIPLFLIAIGAIGIVSKFVSYVRTRISKHVQVVYLESALYSVESIFFLLGSYWVYKEFKPNFDNPNDPGYCNKTAYMFGFVYLTFYYAIIVTIIFGFCCFLCCILCIIATDNTAKDDVEAQNEDKTEEAAESLTKKDDDEAKP